MEILYQDQRILVCIKPAGIVSTDEPGGLPDLIRSRLGEQTNCLRTVHRLDQVVGGVMVLARSRAAASILSRQIENHRFQKEYLAVIEGVPIKTEGEMRDLLTRDRRQRRTCVVNEPGKNVKEAVLHYRCLAKSDRFALVQIRLLTGRTHQIRCQFSSRGLPIAGDKKYGSQVREMDGIALWSYSLGFDHPQTGEACSFHALPPRVWPWTLYPELWSDDEVELS